MKYILLIAIFLTSPAVFAAPKGRPNLTFAEATAASLAYRLWRAGSYGNLPLALQMTKNDRHLFLQDIKKSRKLKQPIKFKLQGSTLTLAWPQTVFDFSKMNKQIIVVNGKAIKLDKRFRGYRGNQLRPDYIFRENAGLHSLLMQAAHAQSMPPAEDVAFVNALIDENFKIYEEQRAIMESDESVSPLKFLLVQYRNDELLMLQDMQSIGYEYEYGAITMSTFMCEGDNLAIQKHMDYHAPTNEADKAAGEPEVPDFKETPEELLNSQRIQYDKLVAERCCKMPGTECEKRAMKELMEIAARHKSRSGKGWELVQPPVMPAEVFQ